VTLLPGGWNVEGVEGPAYKVGPRCSNPTCRRWVEHTHHLWRRSLLGGPFDWVKLDDGRIVANLCGLCPRCHDDITGRVGGHKAAIRLLADGLFWWCRIAGDKPVSYMPIAPLDPAPPVHGQLASSAAASDEEPDRCPTCGRQSVTERGPRMADSGAPRHRKSWNVKVPDDEQERGAEVLDALVEDLAPFLGIDPTATGRYYVIVPALVFATQERDRFLDSLQGVGS
jgi:hypothetical protein